MKFHTSKLDELFSDIASCDGNPHATAVVEKYAALDLVYDTVVDQGLSPFSQEYFDQQVELYREISGRDLNQESGELHPFHAHQLLDAPNPLGIRDVAQMGSHVRALSTMLTLSTLSGQARILDMGAGHGLSSEVFAFAGAHVHAVDIDPGLAELSRTRAQRRNLDIVRSDMNYDDISGIEDGSYDGAFFFQSLHHCLRPWKLIEQLKRKITEKGVIAFVGEPVQTYWWKHWGIRLDRESLYVARGQGWFESGFSHEFIASCFSENGMKLLFFSGGYLGGEIGIAASSEEKLDEVRAMAITLGLREYNPDDTSFLSDLRYASLCGDRFQFQGRPGFRQRSGEQGVLVYGPYVSLSPGRYELSLMIGADGDGGEAVFDVVSDFGSQVFIEERASIIEKTQRLYVRHFDIEKDAKNVESRVIVRSGRNWRVSLPVIRKI